MINVTGLVDKLVSHALTLGVFESVNTHEPKSAPGHGFTAAIWVQAIDPIQASGLDSTSGRIEFRVRVYTNMLANPQDDIDPAVMRAVDVLMDAYSGDFDLAATVRYIDLLGAHGQPLSGRAGYIPQDGKLYRIFDITLPVIVNDVWSQNA